MQSIAHVAARIREIQSRVEAPPVPGQFRAMLDQNLDAASGRSKPGSAGSEAHPTNGPAVATWQSVPAMTLGMMLGMPTVTATGTGTPTAYPPLPPVAGIMSAAELDAYLTVHNVEARNGRLTDGELMAVSGGWTGSARLIPPAGAAWEEMRAAAGVDGIDLKVIDSYRTWESQARAYEAHLRGEKKANVLPPGRSEHGNGLAIDVTNGAIVGRDDPEWVWLQANASRFGWYPISNETWHWEFRGTSP